MSTGMGTDQAIRLVFSLGLDDNGTDRRADPMRRMPQAGRHCQISGQGAACLIMLLRRRLSWLRSRNQCQKTAVPPARL
jgi:hypothetical protein